MNSTPAVVVGAAALLLLSGCSLLAPSGSAPSPTHTAGPGSDDASAFEIRVGDCLNDATASGTVTTVPIVPCTEPHDSEAYASIMLDDGDFPGDDAIQEKANAGCVEQFTEFVGLEYNASELEYTFYFPSEDSWSQGDREILCEVYDPESQTTGTLRGAAR
jgi:hypothetical protein